METLAGSFYAFQLIFNAPGWCATNFKAAATPTLLYTAQLCGVLCVGIRLLAHHARTTGKRKALGKIPLDAICALIWGGCAC